MGWAAKQALELITMIAVEAATIAISFRRDPRRKPPIRRELAFVVFCGSIPLFFFSISIHYSLVNRESLPIISCFFSQFWTGKGFPLCFQRGQKLFRFGLRNGTIPGISTARNRRRFRVRLAAVDCCRWVHLFFEPQPPESAHDLHPPVEHLLSPVPHSGPQPLASVSANFLNRTRRS